MRKRTFVVDSFSETCAMKGFVLGMPQDFVASMCFRIISISVWETWEGYLRLSYAMIHNEPEVALGRLRKPLRC